MTNQVKFGLVKSGRSKSFWTQNILENGVWLWRWPKLFTLYFFDVKVLIWISTKWKICNLITFHDVERLVLFLEHHAFYIVENLNYTIHFVINFIPCCGEFHCLKSIHFINQNCVANISLILEIIKNMSLFVHI